MIKSLWKDLVLLKNLITSESHRKKAKEVIWEVFNYLKYNWKYSIKDNWYWYLLILAGFGVGWLFSAKYYQINSAKYIYDVLNNSGCLVSEMAEYSLNFTI